MDDTITSGITPTFMTTALPGAQVATPAGLWWTMNGRSAILGACALVWLFFPKYRTIALKAGGAFFAYLLLKAGHQKGWY